MRYKILKPNIDLSDIENDIILNSNVVKTQFGKQVLMIHTDSFLELFKIILSNLSVETGEPFDEYVKSSFTFIETENSGEIIKFNKQLKSDINLISKYSFIYLTKSFNTKILLKLGTTPSEIEINDGDLLLFKTEDFVSDTSLTPERIGVFGSLANLISNDNLKKTII
jgi:hypothetical protein